MREYIPPAPRILICKNDSEFVKKKNRFIQEINRQKPFSSAFLDGKLSHDFSIFSLKYCAFEHMRSRWMWDTDVNLEFMVTKIYNLASFVIYLLGVRNGRFERLH